MNLVTAVIVNSAFEQASQELQASQEQGELGGSSRGFCKIFPRLLWSYVPNLVLVSYARVLCISLYIYVYITKVSMVTLVVVII